MHGEQRHHASIKLSDAMYTNTAGSYSVSIDTCDASLCIILFERFKFLGIAIAILGASVPDFHFRHC